MAAGRGKQARVLVATRREAHVRDEGRNQQRLLGSLCWCRVSYHAAAERSYLAPFFAAGVFFAGVGAFAASASCEPVEKLTRLPAGM